MNRKQFIQSVGGECENWTWSWSFVNHEDQFVIFGVWEGNEKAGKALILSKKWEYSNKGRRQPGYTQALAHIELVENHNYKLMTFPMKYSSEAEGDGTGPAKIESFTPKLSEKSLIHIDDAWFASDNGPEFKIPEELDLDETFREGAAQTVSVNSFERSSEARAKCIAAHGYKCKVCDFDFEAVYGPIGEKYIHVHHKTPLSEISEEYEVNPVTDLVPVCPNCHAMIHRTRPALTIEQLRNHLKT